MGSEERPKRKKKAKPYRRIDASRFTEFLADAKAFKPGGRTSTAPRDLERQLIRVLIEAGGTSSEVQAKLKEYGADVSAALISKVRQEVKGTSAAKTVPVRRSGGSKMQMEDEG
ncbi:MAG: hypothetical protein ACYDHD_00180 [Vulcanimicrobiaceae bacterium]